MVRQPPGVASPRAPPELKIKTFRERAKRASEIFWGFWHSGNAAEAYLDQKLRKKNEQTKIKFLGQKVCLLRRSRTDR